MENLDNNSARKRKASDQGAENPKRVCNSEVLNNLVMQVNNIQNFLTTFVQSQQEPVNTSDNQDLDDDVLDLNTSGDLFCDDEQSAISNQIDVESESVPPPVVELHNQFIPNPTTLSVNVSSSSTFTLPVNTFVKEPAVPKCSTEHLEKLKSVQHFDSEDWSEVRYAEVQKKYCATPGFVELDCNEEFKPFETSLNLNHTERGFAAISLALLKQNEALEHVIRDFVSWIGSVEITDTKAVESKIIDLFSQSEYQQISNDLLQMTCGHRADMVQQRRDNLLKSVKNKFVKSNLRKIPPSANNLFNSDDLSSAIEKNGGSSKIFWPSKDSRKKPNTVPAQGQGGNFPMLPAQGMQVPMFPFNNYVASPQGMLPNINNTGFMSGPAPQLRNPTQGRSFRPRGVRPSLGNRSNTKQYSDSRRDGRNKRGF